MIVEGYLLELVCHNEDKTRTTRRHAQGKGEVRFSGCATKRDARAAAKNAGWSFIRGEVYCPDCGCAKDWLGVNVQLPKVK